MAVVLAAIDLLPDPSLVKIAEATLLDKKTVTRLIAQAGRQAGVVISKQGARYQIVEWGCLIKPEGARKIMQEAKLANVVMPPPPGNAVRISDWPQLAEVAWQVTPDSCIVEAEALALYERNWRFIKPDEMSTQERSFLNHLIVEYGNGVLNV